MSAMETSTQTLERQRQAVAGLRLVQEAEKDTQRLVIEEAARRATTDSGPRWPKKTGNRPWKRWRTPHQSTASGRHSGAAGPPTGTGKGSPWTRKRPGPRYWRTRAGGETPAQRRTGQTKPIPRSDMHFGILKTTEETQQLVISPLVANRVGTDSAVLRYAHFTLALV